MARHSKCANFTPCKHGWQHVCSVPMLAEWREISIRRLAVVATCGFWHCLLTVCYSSNICQVGAKYLEFTGTETTPSYKGSQVKVTTTENWSTWLQLEYTHRQVWVSLHLCMCEFHCTCAGNGSCRYYNIQHRVSTKQDRKFIKILQSKPGWYNELHTVRWNDTD